MINTGCVLNLTAQWSDIETSSTNITNVVSDVGNISYNLTYASGTGAGRINQLFHVNTYLSGSAQDVYDLTSATGTMFGKQFVTPFSKVKSISFENVSGDSVDFIVNDTNGFDEPFGSPATGIPVGPTGYLHINTTGEGWTVDATNKLIKIGNPAAGNSGTYELLILGEA